MITKTAELLAKEANLLNTMNRGGKFLATRVIPGAFRAGLATGKVIGRAGAFAGRGMLAAGAGCGKAVAKHPLLVGLPTAYGLYQLPKWPERIENGVQTMHPAFGYYQ